MSEPITGAILLIEDDKAVATELVTAFEREDWKVEHVADGLGGLRAAAQKPFEAIVLDRMLPSLDGMELLAQLREMNIRTPVLILSALGDAPERIEGLEQGADDYLAKPFALGEVVARIRALVRRTRVEPHPEVIVEGPLEVWTKSGCAVYAGVPIPIAPKEFQLLKLLVEHSGAIVTRRMILERVFNWRAESDPGTNIVDVHVHRLRKKIESVGGTKLIRTVRGDGYIYERGGVDAT